MSLLLLASLLAFGASVPAVAPAPAYSTNLEAVRSIQCDEGRGSGFLIGDNILVTAAHVADGTNCKDGETGNPLITYFKQGTRDFALMTGILPDVPYLKYDCKPYNTELNYIGYGFSSYQLPSYGFHQEPVKFVGTYTEALGREHMAVLHSWNRPGHSGGPIMQAGTNVVTGMVNAGKIHLITGNILGTTYSVELKSTILCGNPN